MAQIEVKYYNTYWLKNNTTPVSWYLRPDGGLAGPTGNYQYFLPVFPGVPFKGKDLSALPMEEYDYPVYPYTPVYITTQTPTSNAWRQPNNTYDFEVGSNWIIEEARIYGDFNAPITNRGLHAYTKLDSNEMRIRHNGIIYSGIYNDRTSFNETNVFSVSEDITKAVDPHNGSIQLIDAMDNNLTIYQENKVSQALIDKDAIYSAEGVGTPVSTNKLVIGQVTPYVGEYGISKNPESFAKFGYRRYFSDKYRNAIMRLSRDGLTEISKYGMTDWFRDNLNSITDTNQSYYSSVYTVDYDNAAGTISQDPPFPAVSPPTPLEEVGPWIELDNSTGSISVDDFYNDIEIGSYLEYSIDGGITFTQSSITVTGVGSDPTTTPNPSIYIYLSDASIPINTPGLGDGNVKVRFISYRMPKIIGGFDTYKDNYIISLQRYSGDKQQDLIPDYYGYDNGQYSTLAFDEGPLGWTTFYTFRPDFIFEVKNNLYTTFSENSYLNSKPTSTFKTGLYLHYSTPQEYNNFYLNSSTSSIEFIFNGNPSINKTFKTINYEGNNGWTVDYVRSEIQDGKFDESNVILSYNEGLYVENGIEYRAGFYLKKNKYYANIVNNSQVKPEEILFGSSISGIKGYFATVRMSTDTTTNLNTAKELFSVASEFIQSY